MDDNELLTALFDVVYQACFFSDGIVWSNGITCYATAIHVLAKHGLVEITDEKHRMVFAKIKVDLDG